MHVSLQKYTFCHFLCQFPISHNIIIPKGTMVGWLCRKNAVFKVVSPLSVCQHFKAFELISERSAGSGATTGNWSHIRKNSNFACDDYYAGQEPKHSFSFCYPDLLLILFACRGYFLVVLFIRGNHTCNIRNLSRIWFKWRRTTEWNVVYSIFKGEKHGHDKTRLKCAVKLSTIQQQKNQGKPTMLSIRSCEPFCSTRTYDLSFIFDIPLWKENDKRSISFLWR